MSTTKSYLGDASDIFSTPVLSKDLNDLRGSGSGLGIHLCALPEQSCCHWWRVGWQLQRLCRAHLPRNRQGLELRDVLLRHNLPDQNTVTTKHITNPRVAKVSMLGGEGGRCSRQGWTHHLHMSALVLARSWRITSGAAHSGVMTGCAVTRFSTWVRTIPTSAILATPSSERRTFGLCGKDGFVD